MFSPKNEETIETVISNKSKNETDIEILNKVQNLKQNLHRFCFKIGSLFCFRRLFQRLDLKSGEALNGL